MKKATAIIQARMGSTRLPGKVLSDISGHPMLWHIVNRVRHSNLIKNIIISTTTEEIDDKIIDFAKKHRVIIIGLSISLGALIILILLNMANRNVLEIETRWLTIAGIPILIALICGGYIRKFKGFGIELETTLKSPVSMLDLNAADVLSTLECGEKGSIDRLHNLTRERVAKIELA